MFAAGIKSKARTMSRATYCGRWNLVLDYHALSKLHHVHLMRRHVRVLV